jgi:hypothetical protein
MKGEGKMKRLWIVFAALILMAVPAWAQRVTAQKSDRNQIVHLHTALNHLTVIEVGEPVTAVAAGSPTFKVEWRENKVYVQPTEENISTNLFIWTAAGRLNYELEPAGAVQQMDFAVDDPPSEPPKPQVTKVPDPSPAQSAMEILLSGKPVRLDQSKRGKNKIEVVFRDVVPDGDRIFLRYAIRNQGTRPYMGRTPVVVSLNVKDLPEGLTGITTSQLSEQQAAHLKSSGQVPVEVVDGHIRTERLEPGQETQGIIEVKLPTMTGRRVLRFYFPADAKSQISATLVL